MPPKRPFRSAAQRMPVLRMPAKVVAERKARATTVRLDPALQEGLVMLGQLLKKPLNRLVNEAVRGFIETRSAEVAEDLERALARLEAYRARDPGFEAAMAEFVKAEASLGREDPVEGGGMASAGPAQTRVRELLRG